MGFYDRFQLLDLLRDDGIRTFRAREIATGRFVEAHLILPESPETLKILLKLDFVSEDEKWRILERGDHEGTTCIVTEPLPDYPSFRDWLADKSFPPGARKHEETRDPEKRRLDTEGGWRIRSRDPLDPPEPAAHTLALPTYQPRPSSEPAPSERPKPPNLQSAETRPPDSENPRAHSWSAAATPTVALRLPRRPETSGPISQTQPQAVDSSIPSADTLSTRLLRNVLVLLAILVVVASLVAFVAL